MDLALFANDNTVLTKQRWRRNFHSTIYHSLHVLQTKERQKQIQFKRVLDSLFTRTTTVMLKKLYIMKGSLMFCAEYKKN